MFSEQYSRFFAIAAATVLLVAMVAPSNAASVYRKVRAVPTPSDVHGENGPVECASSTPCGWQVYMPFTRKFEFFMKNTCECPTEKSCQRSEDDLSVSAYVYRCRPITNGDQPGDTNI